MVGLGCGGEGGCEVVCVCVSVGVLLFFLFFKQKTAYEMRISDWSSDVCSSDLPTSSAAPAPRRFTPVEAPKRPEPKRPEPKANRGADNRRQSGKLNVTHALNEDEGDRARSPAALKRALETETRSHTPSDPRRAGSGERGSLLVELSVDHYLKKTNI